MDAENLILVAVAGLFIAPMVWALTWRKPTDREPPCRDEFCE